MLCAICVIKMSLRFLIKKSEAIANYNCVYRQYHRNINLFMVILISKSHEDYQQAHRGENIHKRKDSCRKARIIEKYCNRKAKRLHGFYNSVHPHNNDLSSTSAETSL